MRCNPRTHETDRFGTARPKALAGLAQSAVLLLASPVLCIAAGKALIAC